MIRNSLFLLPFSLFLFYLVLSPLLFPIAPLFPFVQLSSFWFWVSLAHLFPLNCKKNITFVSFSSSHSFFRKHLSSSLQSIGLDSPETQGLLLRLHLLRDFEEVYQIGEDAFCALLPPSQRLFSTGSTAAAAFEAARLPHIGYSEREALERALASVRAVAGTLNARAQRAEASYGARGVLLSAHASFLLALYGLVDKSQARQPLRQALTEAATSSLLEVARLARLDGFLSVAQQLHLRVQILEKKTAGGSSLAAALEGARLSLSLAEEGMGKNIEYTALQQLDNALQKVGPPLPCPSVLRRRSQTVAQRNSQLP